MDTDLQALMAAIQAALLAPFQSSLTGAMDLAIGLLTAAMAFTIGFFAISSMTSGAFPAGSLLQAIIILGIAVAAIENWPTLVDLTIEQIYATTGIAGATALTSPFEVASAGAALCSRALYHAGAAFSLWGGLLMSAVLGLAGIAFFVCYLLISVISLGAWVEFWAAAMILAPLAAMVGIPGFQYAGIVPLSFMISSAVRIAAIGMLATFSTAMIDQYAIPDIDEEITYLNIMVAFALALALVVFTWSGVNNLISGIIAGRPGWAGGLGGVKTAVASAVSGGLGAISSATAGRSASAATMSAASGSGSPTAANAAPSAVASTSTPVNSRNRP
jgi:hypothetical protein